jgi:hypothetical protein
MRNKQLIPTDPAEAAALEARAYLTFVGARTFLSALVLTEAQQADKNVRAPIAQLAGERQR